MHHQPDVRLVDAHAEGVGRRDHPQIADAEAFLDRLLLVRGQTGMKAFRCQPLLLQKLRHLLGRTTGRAIDDRARCTFLGQALFDDVEDVAKLGAAPRGADLEAEVGTGRPAVQQQQLGPQPVLEMVADILDHLRLGRGGQADDRRGVHVTRRLLDEARDVAVIWAEVVAPFRDAMRLVQHPEADLALFQHVAHADAAQLFGRDEQHRRLAQPNLFQRVLTFGHGQQAVDGDGGGNAGAFHPGHLIGHQRHEGRDHDGQRAGAVVLGQRRDLIADRLARAGRQDAQQALPPHPLIDDAFL